MDLSASISSVAEASSVATKPESCRERVPPPVSFHQRPLLPQVSVAPSKRIFGKNQNCTVCSTWMPSNQAELQLFRVLQRASLLAYCDTLLSMGGDDVQQLCDAAEDEFLEIMSLVGMASKPLHVRRLQKALHEWLAAPDTFQQPLLPGVDFEVDETTSTTASASASAVAPPPALPQPLPPRPLPMASPSEEMRVSPRLAAERRCGTTSNAESSPSKCVSPTLPSSPQSPCASSELLQSHVSKLSASAHHLSQNLRQLQPRPQNTKKRVCKELDVVMSMDSNDPRRMPQIRRFSAIYGRFDCKRKPEKPLTLHELLVNEAAAQLCSLVPALLTRRDELFPLARKVVKDSGCYFPKTQLTSSGFNRPNGLIGDFQTQNDGVECTKARRDDDDQEHCAKKPRLNIESADVINLED